MNNATEQKTNRPELAKLDTDARNAAISAEQVRGFKARERDVEFAYLSSDGKKITTWTGDELGVIVSQKTARVGFPEMNGRRPVRYFVTVRGIDGRVWCGTGPGPGMYVRLRVSARQ